ncbi:hypothetical protein MA16_Dca000738 [Dendrobium catenatum]|uniref:Uncharacterized protein n=1 Tax=Dendrobium catenatum TaxID=906689 RepID=A0A2I0WUT6_9ASPA|nr:hypothetical protein MA16_Dca000738 [Dendrobium catenatum]
MRQRKSKEASDGQGWSSRVPEKDEPRSLFISRLINANNCASVKRSFGVECI